MIKLGEKSNMRPVKTETKTSDTATCQLLNTRVDQANLFILLFLLKKKKKRLKKGDSLVSKTE